MPQNKNELGEVYKGFDKDNDEKYDRKIRHEIVKAIFLLGLVSGIILGIWLKG